MEFTPKQKSFGLIGMVLTLGLVACAPPKSQSPGSNPGGNPAGIPMASPQPSAQATATATPTQTASAQPTPAPVAGVSLAASVSATYPAKAAPGVATNATLAATFTRAMDPATINASTFLVRQGTTPIPGTVSYDGTTAIFRPTTPLAPNTTYTATLTDGVRAPGQNAAGSPTSWDFTTGAGADTSAPLLLTTTPANAAPNVAQNFRPTAAFNEPMNPATITAATFTVTQGTTPVAGTVTYTGTTATFTPTAILAANTTYTGRLTTGAKDLAGNPLAGDVVWQFTTATGASPAPVVSVAPVTSLPTVALGATLSQYAVFAYTTVTSAGMVGTVITGDLGLSPGSSVTGFPPAVLNGTLHVADTTAAIAKGELTIAYNDAAGRTLSTGVAGNIGGQTLFPGLYKSTGTLEVSTGNLILDAQGNPNAVFIFQVADTFSVSSGLQVTLAGGAKAANVFWQVGNSANIGTMAVMKGNILAHQSVWLANGASLEGRALASNAAVTLDNNVITKPAS
ncbi:MAG: DUF3494 domain-containing protein [Candidatus Sericytochromatia bacterium]|nr:DUF3494 domain-containing protein [Candidatus Sericytochromatia bacterium]